MSTGRLDEISESQNKGGTLTLDRGIKEQTQNEL